MEKYWTVKLAEGGATFPTATLVAEMIAETTAHAIDNDQFAGAMASLGLVKSWPPLRVVFARPRPGEDILKKRPDFAEEGLRLWITRTGATPAPNSP